MWRVWSEEEEERTRPLSPAPPPFPGPPIGQPSRGPEVSLSEPEASGEQERQGCAANREPEASHFSKGLLSALSGLRRRRSCSESSTVSGLARVTKMNWGAGLLVMRGDPHTCLPGITALLPQALLSAWSPGLGLRDRSLAG